MVTGARRAGFSARPQSARRRVMPKFAVSKQAMRLELEGYVNNALAGGVTIVQCPTQVSTICSKCGTPNQISITTGEDRVTYACKKCGHEQRIF